MITPLLQYLIFITGQCTSNFTISYQPLLYTNAEIKIFRAPRGCAQGLSLMRTYKLFTFTLGF